MSYVVLARKWRPQKFDEIVGQEHIVTTLKNAVESGRIAGAYLFSGSKGVGKTSSARIFAKSLNCVNGPTVAPCQKCVSCVEISESRSMDVLEIDGASNTGVDNIRELRENAKFAPINGKFKIYIIDEVHMLSDSAFNALLKILEEPPEHVKFIFATTHPHKLPPTIISRCQKFDFNRISTLKIIGQLEMIVKSEKLQVEKNALSAIARASEGSMRDAESILDQLLSFTGGAVAAADISDVLGYVSDDWLFEVSEAIARKEPNKALELLDKMIREGKDISHLLDNLISHFRNLMVARVSSGDQALVDLPAEACQRLVKQSRDFSLEGIFTVFNLLVSTKDLAKKIDCLRVPIEVALVKLAYSSKKHHFPASVEPSVSYGSDTEFEPASRQVKPEAGATVKKNESVSKPDFKITPKCGAEPGPKAEKPPDIKPAYAVLQPSSERYDFDSEDKEIPSLDAEYALPPGLKEQGVAVETKVKESVLELTREDVVNVWDRLIQHIEPIKISVASYLRESRPVTVKGRVITALFPDSLSFHKEALERKENKRIIEEGLKALLSGEFRVDFILGKEEEEIITPEKKESEMYIQTTLDAFGGEIV